MKCVALNHFDTTNNKIGSVQCMYLTENIDESKGLIIQLYILVNQHFKLLNPFRVREIIRLFYRHMRKTFQMNFKQTFRFPICKNTNTRVGRPNFILAEFIQPP